MVCVGRVSMGVCWQGKHGCVLAGDAWCVGRVCMGVCWQGKHGCVLAGDAGVFVLVTCHLILEPLVLI